MKARTWSAREGYGREVVYNADVYVFALLAATGHALYDALDPSGWQFWVLPVSTLAGRGASSLSLPAVRGLAGEHVCYANLAEAMR